MKYLFTEIIKISIDSFLLFLDSFSDMLDITFLMTKQIHKFSRVQSILVQSIARIDWQVNSFRLHHPHFLSNHIPWIIFIS